MYSLFALLGSVLAIACAIIILIDAFKNSILKGFLCLLCWFYMLYYAIVHFQHDKKVLIIVGWLFGSAIGAGFGSMLR
ncbi:MAG TPA: hypothetical protein VK171_01845 [Fimbriimonas sp.]|nr:hypothetical protein [Fimbriimonas sp.]